jgi:hypothetical protein
LPTEGEGDPKAVSDDSSTVGIAVGVACGIIVIVVIVLIILWLLKRNSGKDVHFENPVYTNTSDNVSDIDESVIGWSSCTCVLVHLLINDTPVFSCFLQYSW